MSTMPRPSLHQQGQTIINEINLRMFVLLDAMRNDKLDADEAAHLIKMIGMYTMAMSYRVGKNIRENNKQVFDELRRVAKAGDYTDGKTLVIDEELKDRIHALILKFDELIIKKIVSPIDVVNASLAFNQILERKFNERMRAEGHGTSL